MASELTALWRAVRGGATALLALLLLPALLAVAALSCVGVGLPLLPLAARTLRWLAGVERRRVGAVLGAPVPDAYSFADDARLKSVLTDRQLRRDLRWLPAHGITGLLAGFVAVALPLAAVNNLSMPLWWWAVPDHTASGVGFPVDSWGRAVLTLPVGLLLGALAFTLTPRMTMGQARLVRGLLTPPAGLSLAERLAEVTASRAAALEAHGTELRRIERDLHDGTQNRLVAVVMHLGLVERALERNPDGALPLVRRTRQAAVDALDELRDVVRTIYPPILDERGLDGAVAALAARCPVVCRVDTTGLRRVAASVEAAAYFVTAEALNNVAKHSGADSALVRLLCTEDILVIEVDDNGCGGAHEDGGSGLLGIRRRAAALDGRVELVSPLGGPTRLRAELPCGW